MFTQPQQSGLIRVKTHDTSVSRFLISWKAKAPPPPLCVYVCMHLCVMKPSWNRVKHVVSFECMIKGVFAHLPHTNKWVKFVCAPHQRILCPCEHVIKQTVHKPSAAHIVRTHVKVKEIHYALKAQYLREATCKWCRQDLCPLISKFNRQRANLKLVCLFFC